MRSSDNDLLLALGGTIAVHVILIVALDIVQVTLTREKTEVAPRLEYVEIEPAKPKIEEPPPAPPKQVQARVEPQPRTEQQVKPRIRTRAPEVQESVRPPPPADVPPTADPGGAPVVKYEGDLLPGGKIPVAVGKRTTERVGRGGTGTGTGAGSGAGTESAPPPVSVATIKKRAMPKGDFSYFDAGRDYPPAARQAAIEGVIRVKLVVSAEGKVTSAVLINKLGYGLDELALERARKIEFDPAKDSDDKAVASIVIWTFNMTLPK